MASEGRAGTGTAVRECLVARKSSEDGCPRGDGVGPGHGRCGEGRKRGVGCGAGGGGVVSE